jgi:adenosylcobinamide-GDP ribazoletransferase
MVLFREIRNLIAFLTIIPVGMDKNCLVDAANKMHYFPLVGAFIGLIAGVFAWSLLNFFDAMIVGILTLGLISLVTGLHHADGLLDFGDGLMYRGSAEEKIKIMHDRQTGVGGFALGMITFLTTAFCIAKFNQSVVIQSLITCEASAKLAMVMVARLGKSAHRGMNTHFIYAMHDRNGNHRLIVALFITFGLAFALMHLTGLTAVSASIVVALIITRISERHFKGVTGDVFGASNELARLSSLLVIVVMV